MAQYTLRLRRFSPETRPEPWWEEVPIDLDPHRSVLDAILDARDRDGTIGIRYSCRAAICGSCGVRVNGRPGLACHRQLGEAAQSSRDGVITVEPMGNMPVLKDLIVDMDAVHWAKIGQVRPWLVVDRPAPEREHLVPHETMVDLTQSMACIQCGACVSDCLSMEVDPPFVGPAALAKAYRFVADPRDAASRERLEDLSDNPHGLYDCTHCFNCIDACPKGVAPMDQIMRLRRTAGSDHGIEDPNNGQRHARGLVDNVRRNRLLDETELLAASYGGRLNPRLLPVVLSSLPALVVALARGKVKVGDLVRLRRRRDGGLRRYFEIVEGRSERIELKLYVSGREDDPGSPAKTPTAAGTSEDAAPSAPGSDAGRPRSGTHRRS
jgi:succinate dehydrogenase / fumarate reductase iron-sulfur subunit